MNKIYSTTITGSEFTLGKVSVGNIVFPKGDKKLKYHPKEDITAYEVSRLILMFYFASTSSDYLTFDYYSYIQEHNLERHFEEI
nr:MAG: hypothetical protein [Caudoviricetes sp.]